MEYHESGSDSHVFRFPSSEEEGSIVRAVLQRRATEFNKARNDMSISHAALLCSACRVLERLGYDFEENPALSLWWDDHKKGEK